VNTAVLNKQTSFQRCQRFHVFTSRDAVSFTISRGPDFMNTFSINLVKSREPSSIIFDSGNPHHLGVSQQSYT
jgi:hypothetical protein